MSTNHTDSPKTDYIKCIGYGREGNRVLYAEGHEEYRLVHPQDKKQTKRCPACQKAYKKVRTREYAKKTAAVRKVKTAQKHVKDAENTLSKVGGKLTPAARAYLEKYVATNKAK